MFVYEIGVGELVTSVIGGIKVNNEDFTQFSIWDFEQRHLKMSDIQNCHSSRGLYSHLGFLDDHHHNQGGDDDDGIKVMMMMGSR